jgi:phosphatidylglycerophosphate synthase
VNLTDPEWQFRVGPYSRVGSIVNAVFCSAMVLGGGTFALLSGEVPIPFLVVWLAIGVFLMVTFIRIAIRAHRGDYDRYRGEKSGFFGPRGL